MLRIQRSPGPCITDPDNQLAVMYLIFLDEVHILLWAVQVKECCFVLQLFSDCSQSSVGILRILFVSLKYLFVATIKEYSFNTCQLSA